MSLIGVQLIDSVCVQSSSAQFTAPPRKRWRTTGSNGLAPFAISFSIHSTRTTPCVAQSFPRRTCAPACVAGAAAVSARAKAEQATMMTRLAAGFDHVEDRLPLGVPPHGRRRCPGLVFLLSRH